MTPPAAPTLAQLADEFLAAKKRTVISILTSVSPPALVGEFAVWLAARGVVVAPQEAECAALVARARKAAVAVYLAAEAGPAADLSDIITKLADVVSAGARAPQEDAMVMLDRAESAELLREVVALREWKSAHEAAAFGARVPSAAHEQVIHDLIIAVREAVVIVTGSRQRTPPETWERWDAAANIAELALASVPQGAPSAALRDDQLGQLAEIVAHSPGLLLEDGDYRGYAQHLYDNGVRMLAAVPREVAPSGPWEIIREGTLPALVAHRVSAALSGASAPKEQP